MSSDIEWLRGPDGFKGETWNPVVGCTRKSAGCDNCYAISVAGRNMTPQHVGLTKIRPRDASRPGLDWSGIVRTVQHRLAQPLGWRKPRRIFVNSMSDLFHESLPFEYIAAVFGIMAVTRRHTYLTLTKRDMRPFFRWLEAQTAGKCSPRLVCIHYAEKMGVLMPNLYDFNDWPLENVHLGVSAENHPTWRERVPQLKECPASLHWVSCEPLLGEIDVAEDGLIDGLDWIVVGGESGRRARPYDIQWARKIVEDCRDALVPVFHKQLGARPMQRAMDDDEHHSGPDLEWPLGTRFTTAPGHMGTPWQGRYARLQDRKGKEPHEWPIDLRVRMYPEPSEASP